MEFTGSNVYFEDGDVYITSFLPSGTYLVREFTEKDMKDFVKYVFGHAILYDTMISYLKEAFKFSKENTEIFLRCVVEEKYINKQIVDFQVKGDDRAYKTLRDYAELIKAKSFLTIYDKMC